MKGEGAKQKEAKNTVISNEKEEIQQRKTSITEIFEVIKRYDYYIGQANSKASFLISIIGVILFALIMNSAYLITSTEWCKYPWVNDTILLLSGAGLFVALLLSLAVLFPIISSGNEPGSYTSFIAYSSVAKMKYDVFRGHHGSNDYDFWEDLVRQTHTLAIITDRKFILIKSAVITAIFSVIMFLLLFLMMIIKGF